ncbi:uncharacterized protein METZ01_LOCUS458556, partial [marine metagenome]
MIINNLIHNKLKVQLNYTESKEKIMDTKTYINQAQTYKRSVA